MRRLNIFPVAAFLLSSLSALSVSSSAQVAPAVRSPTTAATVQIDGMEVTQSVQHYRSASHLNTASQYGPDNSIRLVSGKATYVRVYLRGNLAAPARASGELRVERRAGQDWTEVATLAPLGNVPVSAQPNYAATRGDLGRTLTFVIPATDFNGVLRLTARVRQEGQPAILAEQQLQLQAPVERTLRLAAITVGYNGPPASGEGEDIQADAPTLEDVRNTAAMTATMFPVSAAAEFRVIGTITLTEPLRLRNEAALACPSTWRALMRQVHQFRTADGAQPDWIYYGVLAPEIPYLVRDGRITTGCGGGGVGTGKSGAGSTMAHEIGHAAGLPHVRGYSDSNPDCTGDGYDARYPSYAPHRRGSVGEYGMDARSNAVQVPGRASDIMTYCNPRWVSPYHYNKLLEAAVFQTRQQVAVRDDSFQPLVSLTGLLEPDGSVSDVAILHLTTRNAPLGVPLRGYAVDLLDARGRAVETGRLYASSSTAAPMRSLAECPCVVETNLRARAGATAIRIRRGETEIYRSARGAAPLVRAPLVASAKAEGVRLSWGEAAAPAGETWLRYSWDGGRTWSVLAGGQVASGELIRADRLPAERPLVFELLTSSGFDTLRQVSEPVVLARRP